MHDKLEEDMNKAAAEGWRLDKLVVASAPGRLHGQIEKEYCAVMYKNDDY